MSKLKILVVPANDGGCAYYRAWLPFNKLNQHYGDKVEIRFNKNPLGIEEEGPNAGKWKEGWEFEDMKWADIVFTQNLSNFGGPYTARIVGKAKEFGKFMHYDTDDLLTDVYEGHRLENVYKEKGLSDITKFIYNNSDLVTVTQKKFAERVHPFCGENTTLAIVKNAIDYDLPCWNMQKSPVRKNLCRVGWVGGIHHEQDLKEFVGVPWLVNQKAGRERVHWDFYGRPPMPQDGKKDWQQDVWDNYTRMLTAGFRGARNWNVRSAQGPDRYGEFYTHMDLAIAPLQFNEFNDSKSEIKVAECGRYGIPLVATNCGCYDETIINGHTGYLIDKSNPKSEWVKIMTRMIKDKKGREEMGANLKTVTDKYFDINKVVKFRYELYEQLLGVKNEDICADENIG
jgi:glycosyltransferase involved in cell wall biosynthesis